MLGIDSQQKVMIPIRSFGVTIVLVLSFSLSVAADGPVSLRRVVEMNQKNREGIKTWAGQASIDVTYFKNDFADRSLKKGVLFRFDREKKAVLWRTTIQQYILQGKEQTSAEYLGERNGMLKRDAQYRFEPGFKDNSGRLFNTLVVRPKEEEKIRGFSDDFDPNWYFTKWGQDVLARMNGYLEHADGTSEANKEVTQQGDKVTWELMGDGGVNHFEFDLSKGGNLVRYFQHYSSGVHSESTWDYTELNAIWVPAGFQYSRSDPKAKEGPERVQRSVRFLNQVLNQPLDDRDFSIEALGVVKGTRISDHVSQTFCIYGETEPSTLPDRSWVTDLEAVSVEDRSATPDSSPGAPKPGLVPTAPGTGSASMPPPSYSAQTVIAVAGAAVCLGLAGAAVLWVGLRFRRRKE